MVRRAFLQWAGAAAVAASVTFPGFGLKAQDVSPEPLEPKEKVQKVVLSPVLEELERWNNLRCESGDGAPFYEQFPLAAKTRANIIGEGYWRVGGTFSLKSRRELLIACGAIHEES